MDEHAAAEGERDDRLSRLTQADEQAKLLVRRVAPIRLEVARTERETEATCRLRYQVTVDQGWGQPEDYPNGLERDAYDDVALHLAAWDGSILAGTSRLVFPAPNRPLPTESAFAIAVEPLGRVVDGSRTAVATGYQGRTLFVALLAASWLQVRERGFEVIAGAASARVLALHGAIGFTFDILGPARVYCGEARYPIRFDMLRSLERLQQKWRAASS
ncbi:MAG TPA: GNAT family N-acyltransferase [Ktedonobacterales bacterium]|nr:GNAT family N-acyltransferase [Ktedonobacterales bacterium]